MLRRTPARLSLFAALVAVPLVAGVVPLARLARLPGGVLPAAVPAGAEEAPLRPGPAYWLAGSDGGVFAFGRAALAGGTSGAALQSTVAGLANTPTSNGYVRHRGGPGAALVHRPATPARSRATAATRADRAHLGPAARPLNAPAWFPPLHAWRGPAPDGGRPPLKKRI